MRRDVIDLSIIRIFSGVLNNSLMEMRDLFSNSNLVRRIERRLLDLSHFHMLSPRFYRLLEQSEYSAFLSEDFMMSLKGKAYQSCEMHVLAENYFYLLLSEFNSQHIPVIVLKGWALAKRYYPVPEDRSFIDLDLLFYPHDQGRVEVSLRQLGFIPIQSGPKWSANHYKIEYACVTNPKVQVECHFAIGYERYHFSKYWERSRWSTIETEKGNLKVNHLGIEDEFAFLVFHAGVQHRFQKLVWLLDLSLLQQAHPELEHLDEGWERLGLPTSLKTPYLITKRIQLGVMKEWFDKIVLGEIDQSRIDCLRLRAMMQGGWSNVGIYALKRAYAQIENSMRLTS